MGNRVELPDGQWAEIAPPKKVPERKRRRYVSAMTALVQATNHLPKNEKGEPDQSEFGSAEMELVDAVGDALIVALVREWSFGEVTPDAVAELPADAFDVLLIVCRDLAPELTPNYDLSPDPKAVTSNSHGSLPGSPEGLSTFEIPSSASTS